MSARILIVEDDKTFRSFLQTLLVAEGYEVAEAADGEKALALLRRESFDLVLSDLKMPGMSGIDLFRRSREETFSAPFVMITAFGSIEEAVTAVKEGVSDFLTKPLKDPDALRVLVRKVLATSLRARAFLALKETEAAGLPPEEVIFAGSAMQEVRRLVGEVAPTMANVLIFGESGTGKELVARTIHLLSTRKEGSFIPLNCAAIPETLLESELFGHEKGAFTGAHQARSGKFELAQGGTIFLDEIGDMPLPLQAKLLRVLQERTFERVGGSRSVRADARVIAATNRDLGVEVRERHFREDLFYRLNVFPITLPPLRERKDALPLLVDYFLQRFARQTGKKIDGTDRPALAAITGYDWPGNVRELQNAIERAVILGRGTIGLHDLPGTLAEEPAPGRGDPSLLKEVERDTILATLQECGNNRRLAAEKLGISKRTLQYRLKQYDLVADDR
jgi:DNA-binding NtrC family response regulator